ncbi:MAG: cation:proton antiporter [Lachnospiraceae bacterium]
MQVLEWIRFIAGALFLIVGVSVFVIEILSVFHLKYSLNRMHAAATGDTLGILFCLIGLIIFSGFSFTTLKLLLVILLLWAASPVSSHLIARMEVQTNEEEGRYEEIER